MTFFYINDRILWNFINDLLLPSSYPSHILHQTPIDRVTWVGFDMEDAHYTFAFNAPNKWVTNNHYYKSGVQFTSLNHYGT